MNHAVQFDGYISQSASNLSSFHSEEGIARPVTEQVKPTLKNSQSLSQLTDNQKLPREYSSVSTNSCGENKLQQNTSSDVRKISCPTRTQRQSYNIFCTTTFEKLRGNFSSSENFEEPFPKDLRSGQQKSVLKTNPETDSESEDGSSRRVLISSDGVDFLNGNFIGLKPTAVGINTGVNQSPEEKDTNMPEPKTEDTFEDGEVTLDLSEPSAEVMEYATRELGETEEVKCLTLQELREMIYERGECTPHRMDDAFLIRFLRARNFNVNRAHRLVVNYCNFKEDHPDIHRNVNPLEMRFIGEDDIISVPNYLTQCGRRMMFYRMGNWDPRKYSVTEIFKATVIVLELGILEPRAQIMGGIVIFDLEGLTMAHVWSVTPQIAKMVMSLIVSAFPMKSHTIHIVHQSWVFDAIFSVFKPLLDNRMRDKLFFHGDDMESLHRHVSPESLPKKYGGTRSEFPYYKWIDSLENNPVIINELQQLGYIIPEEMLKKLEH